MNHMPNAGAAGAVHMKEILESELQSIREAGTLKIERVITSAQAASIKVAGSQGKILNFCANNYLGLSVSSYYFCINIDNILQSLIIHRTV